MKQDVYLYKEGKNWMTYCKVSDKLKFGLKMEEKEDANKNKKFKEFLRKSVISGLTLVKWFHIDDDGKTPNGKDYEELCEEMGAGFIKRIGGLEKVKNWNQTAEEIEKNINWINKKPEFAI